jgi:glycosyltransferase involved in cell wall biosynthesis
MTAIVARYDATAMRSVDAVMVENPAMLAYANRIARPEQQVVYAPPGVDIDLYSPRNPAAPQPERPYIVAVGRMTDPRKNAGLLLEAYALHLAATPDGPDLILAGIAGPEDRFWQRARVLGVAERISTRLKLSNQEIADLIRNAVCLALPSDEEGFGMVVVEAMASAIPVVATRCGGPDGIIEDGIDGFLVDKEDATAMAARFTTLVRNEALRVAVAEAARAKAISIYADELAGRRFVDMYDRLLAR